MQNRSKYLTGLLLAILVVCVIPVAVQFQIEIPLSSEAPTVQSSKRFAVNIPQKALFRNYVAISIEVAPGTLCDLTYISPSGDMSQMSTTANASGLCSWRWKVDETKGKGAGRLVFTIDGVSETHFIEIRSSF